MFVNAQTFIGDTWVIESDVLFATISKYARSKKDFSQTRLTKLQKALNRFVELCVLNKEKLGISLLFPKLHQLLLLPSAIKELGNAWSTTTEITERSHNKFVKRAVVAGGTNRQGQSIVHQQKLDVMKPYSPKPGPHLRVRNKKTKTLHFPSAKPKYQLLQKTIEQDFPNFGSSCLKHHCARLPSGEALKVGQGFSFAGGYGEVCAILTLDGPCDVLVFIPMVVLEDKKTTIFRCHKLKKETCWRTIPLESSLRVEQIVRVASDVYYVNKFVHC
eukprot:TRINITY_DN199_c0_g3_i1.p1 TRINITY_DN199_c0_g3~~TRINITY_DN199_c0_g3_i1.p1  ORF type:complete len:274 (-),score=23.17 TRINITY_DN199_c0_g3_i1:385-1206(-)